MNKSQAVAGENIVWVSEGGLIIAVNEEGYSLEDPLADEPIQWCDSLSELKRIIEDIELNPFKVGDKVRVVNAPDGTYKEGTFDTVHYIAPDGAMCLKFYEEGGVSHCVYTWQKLNFYTGS